MPKKTLNNDFTTLLPDFEEKLLKNLNEPSQKAKIENFSYFGQFVDLLVVLWGRNGPGGGPRGPQGVIRDNFKQNEGLKTKTEQKHDMTEN